MTDRELMQQALNVLKIFVDGGNSAWARKIIEIKEALRARLAQPEQEIESDQDHVEDDGCPTEKAVLQRFWREHQMQEPVAWKDAPSKIYLQVCEDVDCDLSFDAHDEVSWCQDKINDSDIPYVRADFAPPQREWQGLTDEDKREIIDETEPEDRGYVMALVEAKLKEKNA